MSYQVQTAAGSTINIESELIDGNENPKFSYDSRIVVATSSAITTSAYTPNQTVGGLFTFSNAARKASMGGIVQTATLICSVPVSTNYRLLLFDQTITTSDHQSNGFTDADMLKCIGIIDFNTPFLVGSPANNFMVSSNGLGIIYQTVLTKDIYGALITTTGVTLTAIPATGITIRLGCSLD